MVLLFIRPIWVHESRFVPSLLFPAIFALIQDGNQLFTNSLGKPCGGGNNSKTVFFSFFLHTWLYLLMTPALNMLVIPGLPSYNGVEVYYLKGVIGLPIVISFRDRWYILIFFFGNGLIDDVIVIGWTDSDLKISRALVCRCAYCLLIILRFFFFFLTFFALLT